MVGVWLFPGSVSLGFCVSRFPGFLVCGFPGFCVWLLVSWLLQLNFYFLDCRIFFGFLAFVDSCYNEKSAGGSGSSSEVSNCERSESIGGLGSGFRNAHETRN